MNKFNIDFYALSDIGRVRTQNQDNYIVIDNGEKGFLAGVWDGVGGCDDGKFASKTACEFSEKFFLENFSKSSDNIFTIKEKVENINLKAHLHIKELSNTDDKTYQTTSSILYIKDKNYFISHVGDSKIFLLRDNECFLLTKDHTVRESSVLTQVLGHPNDITCHNVFENIFENDIFLLCSDGLTSFVKKEEISEIIQKENSLENSVISLINLANSRGGTDNITVICLKTSINQAVNK
ncbi:MAG: protein phosphatase 2C domain-containing protein [Candidatus Muiribacteriota bacterium]